MTRQLINLGSTPNKGDGDPLRTAFRKINENFSELYDNNLLSLQEINSNVIPNIDRAFSLGSFDNRWQDLHVGDFLYLNNSRIEVDTEDRLRVDNVIVGSTLPQASIYAEDSTLLVDVANGTVNGGAIVGKIPDTSVPDNTAQIRNHDSTAITPLSPGKTGQIIYHDDYLYVCIDSNTWVRSQVEYTW